MARKIFFNESYDIMTSPLYRLHDSLDDIIRQAYYGGRVECGKIGHMKEDKYYYYDFT